MAFLRLLCNFAVLLKLFAVILSFLVLQLSVQPCCLDSGIDKKSEEKIEKADHCCSNDASSSSDEVPSKTCSPFFSCCAGAGFIYKKNQSFKADFIALLREITIPKYRDLYQFELRVSLLQPPQTIS
jgi:hypothetical protein